MSEELSAAECQARVEQFAQITETDEALAQFYLQDRDWNVEASIAAFFEERIPPDKEKTNVSQKRPQDSDGVAVAKKQKVDHIEKCLPEKFSFISWNTHSHSVNGFIEI